MGGLDLEIEGTGSDRTDKRMLWGLEAFKLVAFIGLTVGLLGLGWSWTEIGRAYLWWTVGVIAVMLLLAVAVVVGVVWLGRDGQD